MQNFDTVRAGSDIICSYKRPDGGKVVTTYKGVPMSEAKRLFTEHIKSGFKPSIPDGSTVYDLTTGRKGKVLKGTYSLKTGYIHYYIQWLTNKVGKPLKRSSWQIAYNLRHLIGQ